MLYKHKDGKEYILNLVDTPGHVDFTYEVSRALEACEGALLIIDASQGVEAQTLANTMLAKKANLKIIPVINKIDLPTADVDSAYEQMKEGLSVDAEPILASAKEGIGMQEIIDSVIDNIPAPVGSSDEPLSALIFDSFYDSYRGVIVIVRVFDGKIKKGMKVTFMASNAEYEVLEVGYMKLKMIESDSISAGEVGLRCRRHKKYTRR
jgi:GTP-binding protein LepA